MFIPDWSLRPTVMTQNKAIQKIRQFMAGAGAQANRVYGLDLRSLALFRIFIGIIVLVDLAIRARDIEAFYTDAGTLPRQALMGALGNVWHVSIHMISGTYHIQLLLFILAGIFALAMVAGYRTKAATILTWFMMTSLHARNINVCQGGDMLFHLLIFWGMFLPLGACCSVDSALNTNRHPSWPVRVFSFGSVGYLAQVILLYIQAVVLKTGKEWHEEGSAIYYALSLENLATPLAKLFLMFPEMLKAMTPVILFWELIIPFFFLFPFWVTRMRLIGILLVVLLHAGFAVGLYLGPFPWINMTSVLPFLPTAFWDAVLNRAGTPERASFSLVVSGLAGMSHKLLCIFKTFFLVPETLLQVVPPDDSRLGGRDWAVVCGDRQTLYGAEAFGQMCRMSPLLWPIGKLMGTQPLKALFDAVYRVTVSFQSLWESCFWFLRFRPVGLHPSKLANLMACCALVIMLGWNWVGIYKERYLPWPMEPVGHAFQLNQYWTMFAPRPPDWTGWYVVPGKLSGGSEVDVFHDGRPVQWEKPTDNKILAYKNERWRKYMMNLSTPEFKPYLQYFADYMCHAWNTRHSGDLEQHLDDLEIYYLRNMTLLDGKKAKTEKFFFGRYHCNN